MIVLTTKKIRRRPLGRARGPDFFGSVLVGVRDRDQETENERETKRETGHEGVGAAPHLVYLVRDPMHPV